MPEREELINKITINLKKRNLQCTNWFIEKIIQIYEMILVRHGLMIIGEPLSGKTCAYQVQCNTKVHLKVKKIYLNMRNCYTVNEIL